MTETTGSTKYAPLLTHIHLDNDDNICTYSNMAIKPMDYPNPKFRDLLELAGIILYFGLFAQFPNTKTFTLNVYISVEINEILVSK